MIDPTQAAAIAEPVYAAQNWTWYTGRPSRGQLARVIEELIDGVSDREVSTSETGRLVAVKTNYDGVPEIKICLILDEEYPPTPQQED